MTQMVTNGIRGSSNYCARCTCKGSTIECHTPLLKEHIDYIKKPLALAWESSLLIWWCLNVQDAASNSEFRPAMLLRNNGDALAKERLLHCQRGVINVVACICSMRCWTLHHPHASYFLEDTYSGGKQLAARLCPSVQLQLHLHRCPSSCRKVRLVYLQPSNHTGNALVRRAN